MEQKNGAIVQRLVGYGRLSGLTATQALAQLYAASRLYINFFQPSFKLKAKRRDGARVSKTYHPAATPCERLLASPEINDTLKSKLRLQFEALDPVALLRDIRSAQQLLAELSSGGAQNQTPQDRTGDLATFLASLASAWKAGEVRPTHRQKPAADRWWRTRSDPFEHAWPVIQGWLEKEPTVTAKELMARLAEMVPDAYAGTAQLRTLQRRIKDWRAEKAKDLILGRIRSTSRQPAAADNEPPRA